MWNRLNAGLSGMFGDPNDPVEQGMVNPGKDARLALAAQLLGGTHSGAGFNANLGQALLAGYKARSMGQQQNQQAKQAKMEEEYRRAQMAQLQAGGPQDPENYGQPQMVIGSDGKPSLVQFGNRGTPLLVSGYQPSPLEQYGRVNPGDYTPESLAKYAKTRDFGDLVRIWSPQVETIGSVPTVVGRQVGGGVPSGGAPMQTPLSSVEREAAAKAQIAGAEAGAKATATSVADRAAVIQRRGADANSTLVTLDLADPLIDAATGSLAGAGVDKLASVFGAAPSGAQAIASLQVLQANLMTNMPRMEGPQSDRDVDLYRQAAGQIGDPKIPKEIKKAAVKTIRALQNKYKERAANANGGASGSVDALLDKYAPKAP